MFLDDIFLLWGIVVLMMIVIMCMLVGGMCVCLCECVCSRFHVWKAEDNSVESVLSLYLSLDS